MNFQANSLQPSFRDWPLHPTSILERPFDCIQQERPDIVELKTAVVDTIREGGSFSGNSKTFQSDSRRVFTWRKNRARFLPSYVGQLYTTVRFRCGYCQLTAL
ncbi:hypothetical protein TNCV_2061531 [Trichonephila clavipes]|nr:hypothetical protein TNCV_2061531 [Trichonephila clavipes]